MKFCEKCFIIKTMKPVCIRFKGKKYYIKPAGIAIMAAALVLIVALVITVIVRLNHKKAEPEEETEPIEEVDTTYDAKAGILDKKEYDGTVLEETEDAGIKYVESTLFLGDSNTARFLREINPETKKTFTSKENSIGVVGMGIDAIASFPCMDFSTGRVSMPQAVKILQPERVIITMGTNNLYGKSTDSTSFIERYTKGIRAIEKAYPSVDIIVNSIPPVAKNTTYTNVSMTQIDAYNKAIAKMCKDNDWKYLDSAETMKDEKTGYAKDGYTVSADGLHLSNKGLVALFKYIRTHSYITDDDRPKPLATIPTIIGVPDGLIKTDPLTNSEYKEDPATMQSDATPEATATPTPTPTASATPTPTSNPAETACKNYGGTWNGASCSCQALGQYAAWNASNNTCGCQSGYTRDSSTGQCVAIQQEVPKEEILPPPDSTNPSGSEGQGQSSDSGSGNTDSGNTGDGGTQPPADEQTVDPTPSDSTQPEVQPGSQTGQETQS